jgi:hypothetical protein
MPKPENLQVDDLQEGQRIAFAPDTVGVCHSDFGIIAEYVALVERVGDVLMAELADGRRYEVQRQGAVMSPRYSLCALRE